MATNLTDKIEDTIREAAIAKGFADASIVPQNVQDRVGALDVGGWFVLSIKRQAADDWELLGRRRTKDELLGLLNSRAFSGN